MYIYLDIDQFSLFPPEKIENKYEMDRVNKMAMQQQIQREFSLLYLNKIKLMWKYLNTCSIHFLTLSTGVQKNFDRNQGVSLTNE